MIQRDIGTLYISIKFLSKQYAGITVSVKLNVTLQFIIQKIL